MRQISRRALAVACVIAAALVGWGWWSGYAAVRAARRDLAVLEVRRQQLEEANRRLAREVEALRRESEARARAARESMDVAGPSEVVVLMPPTPTPAATPSP